MLISMKAFGLYIVCNFGRQARSRWTFFGFERLVAKYSNSHLDSSLRWTACEVRS